MAIRPSRVRVIGLAVALALIGPPVMLHPDLLFGASISLPWFTMGEAEPGTGGSPIDWAFAATAVLVAALFSWGLAEKAVVAGWRAPMSAILAFAIGAVVLGSFVVAGLASLLAGADVASVIGSTIAFGLLGLVFVGIPMLVFGLVLAAIWVVVLRAAIRL